MAEKTKIRNMTKSMKTRIVWTLVGCMLFFVVLIGVLFKLQLVDYETYKMRAESQQLRSTIINANRGIIYDTNMNILAQSATAWTVTLSPNDIAEKNHDAIADYLSQTLGVSRDTLMGKLNESNFYSIVKRKVEQSVVNDIRAWASENKIKGINFTEDSKRYYPYGNFLASVLGFVGTDNTGLYGLEAYYNSSLRGTSGRVLTAKNAWGSDIYYEYETYYESEPGYNLVLTIDEYVQYYLEKYVEEAMATHKVQNYACGIVMNVKTGAILGMTTKPDYDPNTPLAVFDTDTSAYLASIAGTDGYSAALAAAQYEQWANKAIQSLYEPGSVFKVVTSSAALDTGAATLDSTFTCKGYAVVDGTAIGCWHSRGHGTQTFTQAVVNSCNPAFIKLAQTMGADTFFNYFKAYGLTEKTGVDLLGETSSVFHTRSQLGIIELSSSSFGQSFGVTPLQMITAFSASINGGYLLKPYVVSKIVDDENNIVQSFEPVVKRQVISSNTSADLRLILEQVVAKSTARNAYLKGYRVGGKTGTSEKLGGDSSERVSSFCGFASVDDPEVVCLLMFDTPRGRSVYGSAVAAPAASKVLKAILPHLGVDAVYSGADLETADTAMISVVGKSSSAAISALKNAGFSGKTVGEGSTVVSQYPTAGMSVPKGSSVVLYMSDDAQQTVKVPNLTGKTVANVKSALAAVGLNIRIDGAASDGSVASSQSISSGTGVPRGSVITVSFTDYSITD